MKLKELLKDVTVLKATADMELEIQDVAYDSRKVQPGGMFVAISGFATDGNRFIPMAMEKGAAVIVTAKEPDLEIPYVLVESDRLALAYLGRNFFGCPAASMQMIGVTGTNGKTSSTLLLKHVLEVVKGAKVGLMGTMENIIGDEHIPADRTTPESFELQALLSRMRDAGCTHVIMEVSSHAIALDRVAGITYDVASFTNLTEDHLDFHKTMEAYCDTKAILFQRCRRAVGNRDDSWYDRLCGKAACPVLTVSAKGDADLYARDHNVQVGIIPCADGGSSLDQWAEGSILFDHACYMAELASITSNIGAGIVGGVIARTLARYDLKFALWKKKMLRQQAPPKQTPPSSMQALMPYRQLGVKYREWRWAHGKRIRQRHRCQTE